MKDTDVIKEFREKFTTSCPSGREWSITETNGAVDKVEQFLLQKLEEEREESVERLKAILRKWEAEDIKADGAFFFYEIKQAINLIKKDYGREE